MSTATLSAQPRSHERSAWLSAFEFLLGAGIVIGHNVYRKVPNEVPILFVLGLVSLTIRDGWLAAPPSIAASRLRSLMAAVGRGFQAIGLRRPDSWRRTVLIALAAAALRILQFRDRAGHRTLLAPGQSAGRGQ
jgi:hypothetical protein